MESGNGKRSLDMLSSAAVGGASASVLSMAMLTVFAALTLTSADPARLSWLGVVINLVCCFAGAFIGAEFTEKRPFVAGVISGAMFIITAATVALIVSGKLHFAFLPATAACALLGAFCGSIRRGTGKIPAFDDVKYKE